MTIQYTDANVKKGQLTVSAGSQDYTVDVHGQVNISIKASTTGPGDIHLGSGNDTIQNNGHGNIVADLGAGNDTFVQRVGGNIHIDITGGPGNDVLSNRNGAVANYHYNFDSQVQSNDGNDGIFGFVAGRDHLVCDGTAGTVNNGNFSTFFTVTDAPGSVGDVITDNQGDGWSVQLIGVHLTAAQLLAEGAFMFT